MNAVDTNVFVYWLDTEDPAKQQRAASFVRALLQTPSETVMLWQVAGETLSCLRRWQDSGKVSRDDVCRYMEDILRLFPLALPSGAVIQAAMRLTDRYSLSHWDSMLLGAAIEAGVDMLYTEDLQDGVQYESVRVVNPFA